MAAEASGQPASGAAARSETLDYFSQRRFHTSTAAKIERVFPIRISDQTSHLAQTTERGQYQAKDTSPVNFSSPSPPVPVSSPGNTSIDNLASPSSTGDGPPLVSAINVAEAFGSGVRYITRRFDHSSSEGDGHSTVSLEGQKLYRCEDEPIHIPGAIQRFGALVGIREDENGCFLVRVASENSHAVIGFDPDALFELRCFLDVLTHAEKDEFIIRIRNLRTSDSTTDQDVFTISLTTLLGAPSPLFCAMHRGVGSDLIICEFEPKRDIFNSAPSVRRDTVSNEFPQVIDQGSSEGGDHVSARTNTPLHSLNISRKFSRPLDSMELFSISNEIQSQLSSATNLSALLDIMVGLVYELTGFHRTMVYQFDEDSSGCVMTELVDRRASTDTYKGLHFPAADIPKQARELYMINKIRILYDRDQEAARLACRSLEDAERPLDLKHSYLRAMSPIHLKYLENMGVQASMSISLLVGGKLWGLISCHNHGSSMRVSLPIRELCRGLGNIASINIEKLMYSSRIQARKPLAKRIPQATPSGYISASSTDLLNMFGADFGFLVIKGEARTIGKLIAYSESIALLHHVRQQSFTSVFSSHEIWRDFKDIYQEPESSIISGMLVIPLALSGSDFLVFFRQGRLKEKTWAGNPNKKIIQPGYSYLQPRSSFKRWSEHVRVESATILSTLYGRFIEVWRQKDATVQKNRMTRLLIRNAGHELRTPLNSIINYLEVALEETLDEKARTHLHMSLQASKSLVFVVNDLLNLTEVEDVDYNIHEMDVNLRSLLCEVITAFGADSAKRQLHVDLEADAHTSWMVLSDPAALRQVVANLLGNAIKHSHSGRVRVHMQEINNNEVSRSIEISFEDEGSGLSEQHLNNIFQSFERIMDEEESHMNEPLGVPRTSLLTTTTTPMDIGLGLAVTARFVRLNHGQIRIASEGEGKGTNVSITVPFRKALQDSFGVRELSPQTPLQTPRIALDLDRLQIDSIIPAASLFGNAVTEEPKQEMAQSSNITSPLDGTSPSLSSLGIGTVPFPTPTTTLEQSLTILVAEDNPLNSRLLETRLRKRGHMVTVAVNGQDCFDTFIKSSGAFDVILMDMQMPFIDGTAATLLIREAEEQKLSASEQGRSTQGIPIIAVSASLKEHSRHEYASSGFNGWVLKPIDFKRLESILTAVKTEALRKELTYGKGSWDKGGWFGTTNT